MPPPPFASPLPAPPLRVQRKNFATHAQTGLNGLSTPSRPTLQRPSAPAGHPSAVMQQRPAAPGGPPPAAAQKPPVPTSQAPVAPQRPAAHTHAAGGHAGPASTAVLGGRPIPTPISLSTAVAAPALQPQHPYSRSHSLSRTSGSGRAGPGYTPPPDAGDAPEDAAHPGSAQPQLEPPIITLPSVSTPLQYSAVGQASPSAVVPAEVILQQQQQHGQQQQQHGHVPARPALLLTRAAPTSPLARLTAASAGPGSGTTRGAAGAGDLFRCAAPEGRSAASACAFFRYYAAPPRRATAAVPHAAPAASPHDANSATAATPHDATAAHPMLLLLPCLHV